MKQKTLSERQKQKAAEVVAHLFTKPFEQLELKEISQHCNVSIYFLENTFITATQKTIAQVQHEIMMQAAAARLLQGISIKVVSIDCKYADVKSFGKAFKKFHSVSPSYYVRKNKI